jgi:transcriptional regulator with AAA-type ATPase domain
MLDEFSKQVSILVSSRHFEEAAIGTLRQMLLMVEQAVTKRYGQRGRVMRGVIHLRPHDTYRRLVALEWEHALTEPVTPAALTTGADANVLASATAWRSVSEHQCAVAIDVHSGTFRLLGRTPGDTQLKPLPGVSFTDSESNRRYVGRQATHVCVLPLRSPGGAVEGMLSIEAACLMAVGEDFVWPQCLTALQVAADVAAPYLFHLPLGQPAVTRTDELLPVVGASTAELISVLSVFAQQEETLLISGPTGAGKSRLALWCHAQSHRKQKPFEVLDLMTVPEELQMAELFGWKKGSFTGASRDTAGSLGRAEGGTLFIDEVDKLSLRAQAGLLNLLESRTYRMLGEGAAPRPADVRFIVGTNADLRAEVEAGRFREDLYYRIHVLPVRLPALDERKDEIALWARYMLERRHRQTHPQAQAHLTTEAERMLRERSWPGNLRQLDNIIRRAYSLALVEHGGVAPELVLQASHIQRALGYETASGRPTLQGALRAAAEAFVEEAQRAGRRWDLDLADGFKGFVLGTAVQRLGLEQAMDLLGRGTQLRDRNHHRILKRELDRLQALAEAMGLKEIPFEDVLGAKEEGA